MSTTRGVIRIASEGARLLCFTGSLKWERQKMHWIAAALERWRKADEADDLEAMHFAEDEVYRNLDPAIIPSLKFEPPEPECFREEGFDSAEAFFAEVDRCAKSCLLVMWLNGEFRAAGQRRAIAEPAA